MVHDPITKGRGADQPPFGIMNVETDVAARLVAPLPQFALQLQQIIFKPVLEEGDARLAPFAFGGFMIGE